MGIDELVVDPVLAALGKLVHVQFARGEHHLAHGAVDLVAVDIDAGKIVVGANLLNLAQGIFERLHVPQPNVLKRGLVVGRIGCAYGRLRGKLALREAVQSVCLPGHLDVVDDIRLLAHQFVGLYDEAADVPANHSGSRITNHGRNDGNDEHAPARLDYGAGKGDQGSQHEGRRDEEHAGQRYVRVCVRDPIEDCVVLKQQLKAADIYAQSNDEQQKPNRDGEPAPRQWGAAAETSAESAGTAGDEDEQKGKDAGEHCQRKQPAGNKLQGRQGEEIEVERPAEDGIGYAAGGVRRIPEERQSGPLRLHRCAGRNRNHERNADGEQAQDRSNRKIHCVSRDENGVIDWANRRSALA